MPPAVTTALRKIVCTVVCVVLLSLMLYHVLGFLKLSIRHVTKNKSHKRTAHGPIYLFYFIFYEMRGSDRALIIKLH